MYGDQYGCFECSRCTVIGATNCPYNKGEDCESSYLDFSCEEPEETGQAKDVTNE
jgi:hypothetical protein